MSPEDEFIKAFDELSDALYRHCFFRVFDEERAKDIVQEAFTNTWDYIRRGGKIKNFRAFLYRVARNLIIDASRRKKSVSLEEIAADKLEAFSQTENPHHENRFDAKRVVSAIMKLSEKYREIATMRFIDDLSVKEIASLTNLSENAVSVRIHRAASQLKKEIAYE